MGPNEVAAWLKLLNEGGPIAVLVAAVSAVMWAVVSAKNTTPSPPVTKAEHDKLEDKVDGITQRVARIEGQLTANSKG
jgi:hypothetical protein